MATMQQQVQQDQLARTSLQTELEKQKQAAYINTYTDKVARRDSVINELRAQLNCTDQKNQELLMEIHTLKQYIVDLKAMIKLLLNPEGIPGLDKAQHAEIALTSMDQYLD